MVRFCAKSRSRITSSRPPCPEANTRGTFPRGGDNWPLRETMRIRPGRSVTSMRPSGKNASDHGCTKPLATVCTEISPAELGNFGSAACATAAAVSSAPNARPNCILVTFDSAYSTTPLRANELKLTTASSELNEVLNAALFLKRKLIGFPAMASPRSGLNGSGVHRLKASIAAKR